MDVRHFGITGDTEVGPFRAPDPCNLPLAQSKTPSRGRSTSDLQEHLHCATPLELVEIN
jgi:hypothetical protein